MLKTACSGGVVFLKEIHKKPLANTKNGRYDLENDNFRVIINERQSAIKVKAMLLKDVLIFS